MASLVSKGDPQVWKLTLPVAEESSKAYRIPGAVLMVVPQKGRVPS